MSSKHSVMEAAELSKVLSEVGSGDLNNLTFSRIAAAVFQDPDGRSQIRSLLSDWDQVSSSFPSKMIAGVIQGYCHFILGDLEQAYEVLAKEKRNSWGVYYFIRTALARELYDEALGAVDDACQKFPDFHPLTLLMIEVYCKTGWEEEVSKVFKKLGKELENTAEYALHKGMYHESLSEFSDAIECYRKAVELDPQNAQALFRLAFCLDLYGKGDEASIDEAIEALESCVKIFPPYTNAVLNLGILYEDRERHHDAIKCFEAVLRTHPGHERARMFLEDAQASTRMFYDKEEEKKADRQSQVLKIPVSDFELSVRSRNCLQKMNIITLGDLIMKTEQELLSYKNFGETSLKEIKDMLGQKGLRLGQGLDHPGNELNAPRNPLEAVADPDILNKPIEELSLSVRSRRCMERLGVKSVRDLINKTEVQLMSAKNFGMTSLNEIKRKIAEYGLKLRG